MKFQVIAKCVSCGLRHNITKHSFGQELECFGCGEIVVSKSGHASIAVEDENYCKPDLRGFQ